MYFVHKLKYITIEIMIGGVCSDGLNVYINRKAKKQYKLFCEI